MNKKGFTLIEIIICIGIISIIGTTTSVITIKLKNNKSLNDLTNNILKAAEVYANTEKDENGNNYINEVENGRGGIKIPLSSLVNKGYVKKEEANKIYKEYKNSKKISSGEDYYILLADGSNNKEEYYCENNEYKLEASWKMDGEKTIYLCNKKGNNTNNVLNMVNVASTNVKFNLNKIPVSEERYNELKNTLTEEELKKYTDKENGWFIWYNTETENAYSFFRGSVNNNYVKFGKEDGKDLIWRIVWIRDDGQMKLILNNTIPYKFEDTNGNIIEAKENDTLYLIENKVIIGGTKYPDSQPTTGHGDFYYNGKWCRYNNDGFTFATNHIDSCFDIVGREVKFPINDLGEYLEKIWLENTIDVKNKSFITNKNNFCDTYIESQYYHEPNNIKEANFDCYYYDNGKNTPKYYSSKVGELSIGDIYMAGVYDETNYLYSDISYELSGRFHATVTSNESGKFYYNSYNNKIDRKEYISTHDYHYSDLSYFYDSKYIEGFDYYKLINLKPAIIIDTNKILFSGNGTMDNMYTLTEK